MEAVQPAGNPLRIEVATAHIDGGQAIGWADPGRVIGCVAFCEPPDAFERFVLPHLEQPETAVQPVETLPPGVSRLVAGLESAHHRLYRENHSVMKDPKWVRLTAACADESRIYFVRTQSTWLYLLRGGKTHLLGEQNESPPVADPRRHALGGPENLRLQVTSLGVMPDDEILLVTGDAAEPPDLRAIGRLFAESRDLKRASDGLVNLLGLQGPSAAVVAFRFAPLLPGVAEKHLDLVRGEAVLGELSDLARELVLGVTGVGSATTPAAETVSPAVSRTVPSAVSPTGSPEACPDGGPGAVEPARPAQQPGGARDVPGARHAGRESDSPEHATVAPAAAGRDGALRPRADLFAFPAAHGRPRSKRGTAWPVIAVALLLFALAALLLGGAGWPGVVKSVRAALGLSDAGLGVPQIEAHLTATSNPSGAVVAIDGIKLPGKTPLHNVRIAGGPHIITMHLGAAGVWADSLDFGHGESHALHADFLGGLEITAQDLSGSPRAWLAGQDRKYDVPIAIDNLPAGWYRVFFEDEKVPLWERKVLVRHGEVAQVAVNNAFAADRVLVRVESMRMLRTEGLRPVEGDSVLIDGEFVGLTPLEMELSPELHGIDVISDGECYSEILQVPAGASRFITPLFGLRDRPQFDHLPPGQAVIQEGELLLAVQIQGPRAGDLGMPRLRVPGGVGGIEAIPLVSVEPGQNTYIARVRGEWLRPGREVPYYFSVTMPEGEEVVSSLYRILILASPEELTAEQSAS